MAIDYDRLMAIAIPDVEQTYDERDTILYALGIGVGHDPLDPAVLRYCYEAKLETLPTLPVVLSHPGFWMRDLDTGIDHTRVVHGEQGIEIFSPPPVAGTVISKTKVVDIIDKGEGRGAIVVFDRTVFDKSTGSRIATLRQSNFCRNDGGFGGRSTPAVEMPKPTAIADRPPDYVVDMPTRPEMALIYRLSADRNPLHIDPAVAAAAGFPRPILHGLATFGIAGFALLSGPCNGDNSRLAAMSVRFAAPVFPGETIRTSIWRDGDDLQFSAFVVERDTVVLTNGSGRLRTD